MFVILTVLPLTWKKQIILKQETWRHSETNDIKRHTHTKVVMPVKLLNVVFSVHNVSYCAAKESF